MKRLFAALAILVCGAAGATTLSPVQLLNPAGSTAGQAVLSTGPNTPPAWAAVSVSAPTGTLPVANGGTGATTAAAARANLGAAQSGASLAQFSSTTSAQLAGVLTDETGTGAAVFGTSPTIASPTISTPAIIGVTNAGNAAAGNIGEYLTNSTSGTPLTSGVNSNCTSLSLTAGDWDVQGGVAEVVVSSTPTTSYMTVGVSGASGALGALGAVVSIVSPGSAGQVHVLNTPVVRFNVSTPTTVYAVAQVNFSGGTLTCSGFLRGRRIR